MNAMVNRVVAGVLSITVAAAMLAPSAVASADTGDPAQSPSEPMESRRWVFEPLLDLPVLALELTVGFGWLLGSQLAPAHCAPLCNEADVWAIDRGAAGNYDTGWKTVGDVAVATLFVGSALALAIDEEIGPALEQVVVIAEAAAGAIALSILSNMSTRRPRPYLYGTAAPEHERNEGTATYSFFSGHTAGAFAATVSVYQALSLRYHESMWPALALGVGLAGSALVGVSRVLAGEHFPTDVLAGAVVGSALGILVPALHDTELRITPEVSSDSLSVVLMGQVP